MLCAARKQTLSLGSQAVRLVVSVALDLGNEPSGYYVTSRQFELWAPDVFDVDAQCEVYKQLHDTMKIIQRDYGKPALVN